MRKPKAGRSYTLDLDVIMMLERYCSASETWDKRKSRSSVVNDAIRWFLTGDVADRLHSHEALQERYRQVCIELSQYKESSSSPNANRSWWRRLLGLN